MSTSAVRVRGILEAPGSALLVIELERIAPVSVRRLALAPRMDGEVRRSATLTLPADTRVLRNGRPARVTAIAPGDELSLHSERVVAVDPFHAARRRPRSGLGRDVASALRFALSPGQPGPPR